MSPGSCSLSASSSKDFPDSYRKGVDGDITFIAECSKVVFNNSHLPHEEICGVG